MGDPICATLVDTRQHLPKLKLWKQYPEGGDSGSLFPGVMEYPHELLFSAIESEELGENFGKDSGNSADDHPEKGALLTMTASLEFGTRESATEHAALEGKIPQFLSSFHLFPSVL